MTTDYLLGRDGFQGKVKEREIIIGERMIFFMVHLL
jgi:hypothetical protein